MSGDGTRSAWLNAYHPSGCSKPLRCSIGMDFPGSFPSSELFPRDKWIALDVKPQRFARPFSRIMHADPRLRDDPERFEV